MSDRTVSDRPLPEDSLVSVVLPVYNEAKVLPELVCRVRKAVVACGADYEIVLVNDGSRDQSPRVLDELAGADPRVRVIHLSRNYGHQAAVQAGLAHTRGDAIVLMDADLQDAPEAIGRFLAEWQAGYDVVYAVRTHRKEGAVKRLLFATFHRLMSAMASVSIPADAGIFGLIDRRVARDILSMAETDRYFPGLRSWVGFRQTGVTVERNARYDDCPRVSLRGLFRLAKTAMFSFSTMPLAIFQVIGVSALILFLGLSVFSLCCKILTDLAVPGWASYMLVGSFFGALNALGISILGEYVIRIYDQVRGRPLYLVDRTVNMHSPTGDMYLQGREGKTHLESRSHGAARDPSGRALTPDYAALDDSFYDDRPYVELMDQAMELLGQGSRQRSDRAESKEDDDRTEPVVIPIHQERKPDGED